MNIAKEVIEGLFTEKWEFKEGEYVLNAWSPAKLIAKIEKELKDRKPEAELIELQNEWDFTEGNVMQSYYYGSSGEDFGTAWIYFDGSGNITVVTMRKD